MKRMLSTVVAVLGICVSAFAGEMVAVQWEKPIYGVSTNATFSYTFNLGTRGVLDNIQVMAQGGSTQTVSFVIAQNSGAFTNTLPSVLTSNTVSSTRFSSSYPISQGDTVTGTVSAPAGSVYYWYVLWFRDVLK